MRQCGDLLKIDAEGYERFMLNGASEMLSKGSINFVVADHDFIRRPIGPHGDFFEIFAILAPLGFNTIGSTTAAWMRGAVSGTGRSGRSDLPRAGAWLVHRRPAGAPGAPLAPGLYPLRPGLAEGSPGRGGERPDTNADGQ